MTGLHQGSLVAAGATAGAAFVALIFLPARARQVLPAAAQQETPEAAPAAECYAARP